MHVHLNYVEKICIIVFGVVTNCNHMCETPLHYHKIVIACKIIPLKTEVDKERVYKHLTAVSMYYDQGYIQPI